MPNLAHLTNSNLPDTFGSSTFWSGEIIGGDADDREMPNEKSNALFAKVKSRAPQTNARIADASALPGVVPKLKIERPAIAAGTQLSQETAWVTLQADANTTGLHTQGRWQADVEIASNLATVLLAQIFPTCVERKTPFTARSADARSACAVVCDDLWVDILLHQIKNDQTSVCQLSMLELAAYRVIDGQVKLIRSVKSSPMPMQLISVFTLAYRLKNGKIMIDICSELDHLTTTHIDISCFGETLPVVKLRSGRALPNGIFRAKYRQIVSWSA